MDTFRIPAKTFWIISLFEDEERTTEVSVYALLGSDEDLATLLDQIGKAWPSLYVLSRKADSINDIPRCEHPGLFSGDARTLTGAAYVAWLDSTRHCDHCGEDIPRRDL